MRRMLFLLVFLPLAACGRSEGGDTMRMSSSPVSVRGWILDVKGAQRGETIEMELARRSMLFLSSSVWVENVDYASGGIAENGSFIVLDVPPENSVLGFNAPGAETAKVALVNIPPYADVLIPAIILENGGATVHDPTKIVVRVSGNVSKPTPTGKTATVAGHTVPVIEVPMVEMENRRDYPFVPGFRPVATVR
ncbi:MAG TPA: hypothetical protein VGQ36_15150 [Thermoanaerobaculia bacterium]|nr:hypothetical protein [Thermoanaerobaculia bacterium]